jgi:2-iminobutanoate/2-iminopropanoate deaminase
MMKKIYNSQDAPAPIGPYNQAIANGNTLYVSGQIPLKPDGSLVEGAVEDQTRQVMENLKAILNTAGLEFDAVLKCSIFLSSMDVFTRVNEVYGSYFPDQAPARETVAVQGLPKGVDVEISCIAAIE